LNAFASYVGSDGFATPHVFVQPRIAHDEELWQTHTIGHVMLLKYIASDGCMARHDVAVQCIAKEMSTATSKVARAPALQAISILFGKTSTGLTVQSTGE
jgi:hypothetical protein